MDASNLLYTVPSGENDLREIIKMTRTAREGCEPFVHCALDGEKAAERFFIGKNPDGKTEKLIFAYGGTAYVFGGQSAEIRTQCSVDLFGRVSGNTPAIAEFGGKFPARHVQAAAQTAARLSETQILQSFLLMTDGKMTVGDEMRYVQRVRTSRRGHGTVLGVFDDNGMLAATSSIIAENEKYALIGDVFTRPDARRRGLAAMLCLECCREALGKGKIPWLMCTPAMLPYYEKIGFREIRPLPLAGLLE